MNAADWWDIMRRAEKEADILRRSCLLDHVEVTIVKDGFLKTTVVSKEKESL
ncbi:MAG TPA: hypothetical protein PLM33_04570 [Acidobacteriota bacterium]|nr:hypothetical protein [Acidobacteriota bacterium]